MTDEDIFPAWPKTPRLGNQFMTITEKIDGTNALVQVTDGFHYLPDETRITLEFEGCPIYRGIRVGSRTRWITPQHDNFGFAAWVKEHALELAELGPGRHYGEWWGRGIQRTYDQTERHFSIFNPFHPAGTLPACVRQVPVLYQGAINMEQTTLALETLKIRGSVAAPGFLKPEGIVMWMGGQRYKQTFEGK